MASAVLEHRLSKKQQIETFFREHLGVRHSTLWLHETFGTAFRSRVSEINRDPDASITICNEAGFGRDGEVSMYWAEKRQPQGMLF
jgi:hypothetical protein